MSTGGESHPRPEDETTISPETTTSDPSDPAGGAVEPADEAADGPGQEAAAGPGQERERDGEWEYEDEWEDEGEWEGREFGGGGLLPPVAAHDPEDHHVAGSGGEDASDRADEDADRDDGIGGEDVLDRGRVQDADGRGAAGSKGDRHGLGAGGDVAEDSRAGAGGGPGAGGHMEPGGLGPGPGPGGLTAADAGTEDGDGTADEGRTAGDTWAGDDTADGPGTADDRLAGGGRARVAGPWTADRLAEDEDGEPDDGEPDDATAAGRPRVLRWSRSPAAILVGVLIGLLGFGIAVQVRSNTSTSGLPAARQEDLVRILDDLSSREDRLRRQIADLEAARARLSSAGDTSSTALQEAHKRSDALGILAGTVAAQGPGVVLTITDPDHRLAAEDLLDTVEELRAAGAEAIQVGGVRVGLDSSFTAVDTGIAVDGVAVTVPYTILAIGEPATLATAMGIPGGVADTAKRAGGEARTEQRQQVVIRALRPVKTPRYSQPTN